jgi:hypothetical protein
MDQSEIGAKLISMSLQLRAAAVANNLRRLAHSVKANFNPNQPRVPRGNPDGGQWTDAGGGGDSNQLASGGRDTSGTTSGSDARGSSHYRELRPDIIRVANTLVPGIVVERIDKTGNVVVGR